MFELGIELSIRDVQLIYKIKDLLGVGTVLFINKETKKELNDAGKMIESNLEPKLKNKRDNVPGAIPSAKTSAKWVSMIRIDSILDIRPSFLRIG